MPPVPKKKHTRSRSGKRRNNPVNKLKLPNLINCPHCGAKMKPHMACPACGKHYRD